MRGSFVVLVAMIGIARSVSAQLPAGITLPANGEIRMSFPPRAGVCGDGAKIIIADRKRYQWPTTETYGVFRRDECIDGPARVSVRRMAGQIVEIRTVVGGAWDPSRPSMIDAGMVTPGAAMGFFMDLAESADERAAEQAVMPAALGTLVGLAPRLIALATDESRPERVRLSAINWMGQIRDDEATRALRAIAWGETVAMPIRSRSLKALWEARANGALMEFARSHEPLELRVVAAGWLGQLPSPGSRDVLRALAMDGGAPPRLRASAILAYARMKKGFAEPGFLIESYDRAGSTEERLAALRGISEQRDERSRAWLSAFAADNRRPADLRRFARARLAERKL